MWALVPLKLVASLEVQLVLERLLAILLRISASWLVVEVSFQLESLSIGVLLRPEISKTVKTA